MLTHTRKDGESIKIGDEFMVKVVAVNGDQAQVDASKKVSLSSARRSR